MRHKRPLKMSTASLFGRLFGKTFCAKQPHLGRLMPRREGRQLDLQRRQFRQGASLRAFEDVEKIVRCVEEVFANKLITSGPVARSRFLRSVENQFWRFFNLYLSAPYSFTSSPCNVRIASS